jgi:hypothetical protein
MQRNRITTQMPTTFSILRTQLTASIRLERILAELTELDTELGLAAEQAFNRLPYPEGSKVEDLDDAGRAINNARSDLEIARRSLLRVWAPKNEVAA